VLRHEPHLQFVRPDDFADQQVVGALVVGVGGEPSHGARFAQDDFVGVQQPGNLERRLFTTARNPRNERRFDHIRGHRHADAAEQLNAFGDGVDQRVLLFVMLVEQQVQLVEGRTRDLPVMLLVHVAKRHRVGEHLIEVLRAFAADRGVERQRQADEVIERLDFVSLLRCERLRAFDDGVGIQYAGH